MESNTNTTFSQIVKPFKQDRFAGYLNNPHSQEVISVLRSGRSPSKLSCDINNLLKRNLTFMYTVHILLTSDRTHAIGYMFHAISTKIRPIYKGEA